MNFKEGFKPNKINLTVSLSLGIIYLFTFGRSCIGGTGLFPCGFISAFEPTLIYFLIFYIISSFILSLVKNF